MNFKIDNLIGITGSSRQRFIGMILLGASTILSVASGFTTLGGLLEYLPFIIAFLVTLGIQSLLFAVCWRIGSDLKVGQTKLLMWLILIVTMGTSIFFSYSSLLDTIYSKEMRKEDEIKFAQRECADIVNEIKKDIISTFNPDSLDLTIQQKMYTWQKNVKSSYESSYQNLKEKNKEYVDRVQLQENLINKQLEALKINNDSLNQAKYQQRVNSLSWLTTSRLIPTSKKVNTVKPIVISFDKKFQNFLAHRDSMTISNFEELEDIYKSIVQAFGIDDKKANLPDSMYYYIEQLQFSEHAIKECDNFEINNGQTTSSLRDNLLSLNSSLTYLNDTISQNLFDKAFDFGKYSGENVHYFVVSTTQLKRKNPLAFGALFIAIAIDLLVFFCGVLGAQPTSLLLIRNQEQLIQFAENGLHDILGMNLNEKLPENAPINIKRMVEILRNSKPSVNLAKTGTPAVLTKDKIDELNLANEVGIFLASGYAKKLTNSEDIGLTTVLLMWLSHQINIYNKNN